MDRAFAKLVSGSGCSLSTPRPSARPRRRGPWDLQGFGVIAAGAIADLVVLDRDLEVVQTWVAGMLAFDRERLGVSSIRVDSGLDEPYFDWNGHPSLAVYA